MESEPDQHTAQNQRHETRDNESRPGGQAAQISLNDEKYCTGCEARTGWVELTITGPPMEPFGKVTYAPPPEATSTTCVGAPARVTVTVALLPPGFIRWMLSLFIPGDALSYQLT